MRCRGQKLGILALQGSYDGGLPGPGAFFCQSSWPTAVKWSSPAYGSVGSTLEGWDPSSVFPTISPCPRRLNAWHTVGLCDC